MKICQICGQSVAEDVSICPNCGSHIGEGIKYIDDYKIIEVVHESYSNILCRAYKEGEEKAKMLRIFTANSKIDEQIAGRLKEELEEIHTLPEEYFVRHYEIKQSSSGLWYRVSEWIDAEKWGNLFVSGIFKDYGAAFGLFHRIASILEGLHQIGRIMPHIILDDMLIIKDEQGSLKIKIDYKVSRFLNPKMDRPSPMLKKLLSCHPDIINRRPLDIKSDIWSLGKIFVEILSSDPDVIDFSAQVDEMPLPGEIRTLLKFMLAEDPGLRPQSMAEVADALSRVKEKDIKAAKLEQIEAAPVPVKKFRGLRKWTNLLALALIALVVLGAFTWYYFGFTREDTEAALIKFASKYSGSVAFVMVDYRIKSKEEVFYHNRIEGTAFLVDKDGYLITNRHVACPWLEDSKLFSVLSNYQSYSAPLSLDYRMFLWFEGERAFNRLPKISNGCDLEDIYYIESAFSNVKAPYVLISGVARSPVSTYKIVKSPLKDDFAVLKIDFVPKGLEPLPLDLEMDVNKVKKLSTVITLGFPLGSSTQANTVNGSVTWGHVRRTFENMFQVDTSLYRGNSGGPIIDSRKRVIGIASAVAMDWMESPFPVATPLSDIGMVLPITKAASFLQDLKSGKTKWNGLLDLSLDVKLNKIKELARLGQWERARELADENLRYSLDPALIMTAGVMHLCTGDMLEARSLFEKAISMDSENNVARFMLCIISYMTGQVGIEPYFENLSSLDWRSPDEFLGYAVKALTGHIELKDTLAKGYDEREESWLKYISGLMRLREGDFLRAQELFKKAVLNADIDDFVYFLALAGLGNVKEGMLLFLAGDEQVEYQKEMDGLSEKINENYKEKESRLAVIKSLNARFENTHATVLDKIEILKSMLEMNYRRGDSLLRLAYFNAMNDCYDQALKYIKTYLDIDGRENAGRLKLGLLEAQIYCNIKQEGKANKCLKDYYREIKDPWYKSLSEYLLSRLTKQSLIKKIGDSPERLLTAYALLGFQAEASEDKQMAMRYYKEALISYMDNWIEYDFVIERVKKLRSFKGNSKK